MKTHIIAISNQKGGVGKTTTAATIAHGLALRGFSTLLIDLDPQANATSAINIPAAQGIYDLLQRELSPEQVVQPSGREGLSLVPGDGRTGEVQLAWAATARPVSEFKDRLKPLRANGSIPATAYDYIVVDTAPSMGGLQERAVFAADLVLIPSATDYLAVEGVQKTLALLHTLQTQHGWNGALLGLLPTFYDPVTSESQTALEELKTLARQLKTHLFKPIHRATRLRDATRRGQTIWETAHASPSALQYAAVVAQIKKVTFK